MDLAILNLQFKYHKSIITDFYNNISNKDSIEKFYQLNGIDIKHLFFQYSTKHKLMRVDIPLNSSMKSDIYKISEIIIISEILIILRFTNNTTL